MDLLENPFCELWIKEIHSLNHCYFCSLESNYRAVFGERKKKRHACWIPNDVDLIEQHQICAKAKQKLLRWNLRVLSNINVKECVNHLMFFWLLKLLMLLQKRTGVDMASWWKTAQHLDTSPCFEFQFDCHYV